MGFNYYHFNKKNPKILNLNDKGDATGPNATGALIGIIISVWSLMEVWKVKIIIEIYFG